jgi:magnesium chelatase family protein
VRSSQYEFSGHELTVNLAPAREKKQGSGFDLAIGLAVLAVSGQAPAERIERVAAAAELGLDGRLRPVAGCAGDGRGGGAAGAGLHSGGAPERGRGVAGAGDRG